MSKIVIPANALARILTRVRGMLPDLKRPATDQERAMVEWLEKMTDESDGNDMDALVRKVGLLRSGWDRSMTALEMHTLHGSSECLTDFADHEWQLMREYLAYQPRGGERFWQVRSREKFLQAPVDTLTAAEEWAKTHRRKPSAPRSTPRPTESNPLPEEASTRDVMREIFKDFLQQ